jgi:dTDP-glucose 4,6-dehydratase
MQYKKILVTGGYGFIGSNFLNKYVPLFPQTTFINVDSMTYAASKENITVESHSNYISYPIDIRNLEGLEEIFSEHEVDSVIHFAAESHVDMSITNPSIFVETNIIGTHNLLLLAKKYGIKRFHHVSTDEVYGELELEGFFTEQTPLAPNSPYSASKASSDFMVRSYVETFGLNAVISRCSNNYGPNQDPTKLIPKTILRLLKDEKIGIYGKGQNIRDWLYVEDHVDAIWEIFTKATPGSVYNIGGNTEKTNLQVVSELIEKLGKNMNQIEFIADRLGHDLRYAIDATKIKEELGWEPAYTFEKGIEKTIQHYKHMYDEKN